MNLIISLIILFCVSESQQQQSAKNNSSTVVFSKDLENKWNKIMELVSFQNTLKAFPYLVQNIQVNKLIQITGKGGCSHDIQPPRVAIIDNNVYIYGKKNTYGRSEIFRQHLRKIMKTRKFPDMYFVILQSDGIIASQMKNLKQCKRLAAFMFSKNVSYQYQQQRFLLPDTYVANPRYQIQLNQVLKSSSQIKWEQKIPKVFFRGAATAPHSVYYNINNQTSLQSKLHRGKLVMMSTQKPNIIDAQFTATDGDLYIQVLRRTGKSSLYTLPVSWEEHIKFKYLFASDGLTTSWKRVPLILSSNSLLFKPYSDDVEWFYSHFVPNVHYMHLEDNLADLIPKYEYLQRNPFKAVQMVRNANLVAQKHLTPQAVENYTYQILGKYAKIQNLILSKQQKRQVAEGIDLSLIIRTRAMRARMENLTEYINIKQLINKFQSIKQNIHPDKIQQLFLKGACGPYVVKFTISQNQVFCQGKQCQSDFVEKYIKILKKIVYVYRVPSIKFLFYTKNQQLCVQQKLSEQLCSICKQIPMFVTAKNISSKIQQNKLMFPNVSYISFMEQKQNIYNLNKSNQRKKWQQKLNKTLFKASFSTATQVMLENQLKICLLSESLDIINLILLSKRYPQLIEASLIKENSRSYQQIIKKIRQVIVLDKHLSEPSSSQYYENYKYLITSSQTNTFQHSIPSILTSQSVLLGDISNYRVEWYFSNLNPGVNFILVQKNFSDLVPILRIFLINDTTPKQIALNAYDMAKEIFSKQEIQLYIGESLLYYAQVQNNQIFYANIRTLAFIVFIFLITAIIVKAIKSNLSNKKYQQKLKANQETHSYKKEKEKNEGIYQYQQ